MPVRVILEVASSRKSFSAIHARVGPLACVRLQVVQVARLVA